MALFSRDKEKAEEKKGEEKAVKASKSQPAGALVEASAKVSRNLSEVIAKPRITEKAVGKGEQNVYTFVVHKDATKHDVRDAIRELFKVTPVKVNIVNKTPRTRMQRSRGRRVSEKGMKKAYVYLRKGDTIELA